MAAGSAFIDEVTITVAAGRGGDGCVSMRREKFVPRGGPDGGDGGRGGDVVLVGDRNLATLLDQKLRREYHAEDGGAGGSNQRTGRDGEAIEIRLPLGTIVTRLDERAAGDDATAGEHLADLREHGQRLLVARGGRGGRGNACFATATRQTPEFSEPGRLGGLARLRLSLKLLADVGLIGFPNAGKSTLLRRISAARPRVGAYPFTTLVPMLGVAEVDELRFVVADIPGLIEGAHEGAGLGDRFLRHIERTDVLVHLLDGAAGLLEGRDLLSDHATIRQELGAYEPTLLERRELVAINKVDLYADRSALDDVAAALRARGCEVFLVSGATGEGIDALLRAMAKALHEVRAPKTEPAS